jgi:hypothetical protein
MSVFDLLAPDEFGGGELAPGMRPGSASAHWLSHSSRRHHWLNHGARGPAPPRGRSQEPVWPSETN